MWASFPSTLLPVGISNPIRNPDIDSVHELRDGLERCLRRQSVVAVLPFCFIDVVDYAFGLSLFPMAWVHFTPPFPYAIFGLAQR